ncbi:MAG: response regulator [Verrucomicrobia bacterium]|nr:response regulator [Verrucomicrobiota bacterium]
MTNRRCAKRCAGCSIAGASRCSSMSGGADLLDALGSHPLDCLLLDLQMEGVNGFEVLEVLLALQHPVPVIVITAHDEPGTAGHVRDLGAVAYLKKPVDRDALFASLSAALTHREIPSP